MADTHTLSLTHSVTQPPSISCSLHSRCDSIQTLVDVPLSFYIPLHQCHISPYPYLHNFLPLPLTLINSNNTPFPAAQPITPLSRYPPSLSVSLSLPLSPFIEPNLFVMSSLGKLRPICCHSLNEFICLCIGHGSISPSSLPHTLSFLPPTLPLTGVPLGALYIPGTTPGTYCSSK